jgi:putative two-component system hydrogenase maturation factor HypX/HoxX
VARSLTEGLQPLGAREARRIGLLDGAFGDDPASFRAEVRARAARLSERPELQQLLALKRQMRAEDEAYKPLSVYRAEELAHMWQSFYGADESYHRARERFVWKTPATETPAHLARHRREPASAGFLATRRQPRQRLPWSALREAS